MSIEVFRRVETKYILTEEKYNALMERISDKIEKDNYFKSTILNLYFDTPSYELARVSLDKPLYKEKIRVRSYNIPSQEDNVFLEIKKKYNGIVSKRRVEMKLKDLERYLKDGTFPVNVSYQIMNEIDYSFKRYKLQPKMILAYDRCSYYSKEDKNFRITFDRNLRSRNEDLELEMGDAGKLYFEDNKYIMEVKTLGFLPIWFINVLEKLEIYPDSFSKYGNIYKRKVLGEISYV